MAGWLVCGTPVIRESVFMMEFNRKLQEMRKQRGLTQEELAEALYVSRTAISKWESGRGTPSIDSLKSIAKFFSVTIDELLSGEDVLTIAKEDQKKKEKLFCDRVFGLLDVSVVMFLFVPFFGQRVSGYVQTVTLLSLTSVALYLKAAYFAVVIGIIASGMFTLALQHDQDTLWARNKSRISIALNAAGVFLFIMSSQPYAGAFLFTFLIIKGIMLAKKQ